MKTRFGPINIISGENKSRFPCCTSLYLDDDVKVLIDPGAGYQLLSELRHKVSIDIVINTHYHFDHIAYNHLFEDARIIINDKEAECFRNRKVIGSLLGMEEVYGSAWVEDWLSRISKPDTQQSPFSPQNNHRWWISTSRVDGEYTWGDVMDFGKTRMYVLGAPGHSGGFSCMYFPEYGAIYVGDRAEDVEAARAAGVVSVGATWFLDAAAKRELEEVHPDHIVEQPSDLFKLALRLKRQQWTGRIKKKTDQPSL